MKYDFHCHSDFSDGKLSPLDLVNYALERNIELLALTDHDTISGLKAAQQYITDNHLPIHLLNGIEISALAEYGEIHIVGLGLDRENTHLINRLSQQQEERWTRAKAIDAKLIKCGVEGVYQSLQDNVKQVVTRTHIANSLVQLGFAKDMQQAFKRYIGKQGRVKVSKNWIPMDEAIQLIKQAGGTAVLAHPTRYPLSNRKLSYLIESFACEGGDAIELSYPSLNKDKMEWLELHREKNRLLASSGSDFHYPNLRWTDLGRFPPIDIKIPHVLEKLNTPVNNLN